MFKKNKKYGSGLFNVNYLEWCTYTQDKGALFIRMQQDNNLVVYAQNGKALWTTNTCCSDTKAYIKMQNDGNLVMYDEHGSALWALFGLTNKGVVY